MVNIVDPKKINKWYHFIISKRCKNIPTIWWFSATVTQTPGHCFNKIEGGEATDQAWASQPCGDDLQILAGSTNGRPKAEITAKVNEKFEPNLEQEKGELTKVIRVYRCKMLRKSVWIWITVWRLWKGSLIDNMLLTLGKGAEKTQESSNCIAGMRPQVQSLAVTDSLAKKIANVPLTQYHNMFKFW